MDGHAFQRHRKKLHAVGLGFNTKHRMAVILDDFGIFWLHTPHPLIAFETRHPCRPLSMTASTRFASDSEKSPLGFSWQREMMSRDRVVDWRKNYSFMLIVCIDDISFTVAVEQIDTSIYQMCCENSHRNCMIRIFWFLLIDVERTNRIIGLHFERIISTKCFQAAHIDF